MKDLENTDAMSWVGSSASIGNPQLAVRAAWQLQEMEQAYGDFITEFGPQLPAAPVDVATA